MCFLTISYRVLERKKKVVWLFTCFRELLLSLVCEPVPFFSLVCLYFALRRQVQDDVDDVDYYARKKGITFPSKVN